MAFERNLDYVDVATRLAEMREKYPNLTMRQVNLEFVNVGGKDYVVYVAAAYRGPHDALPGIGTAWEPIPGPTSFTKDSEVQNAETAAWGRALVAIGASTKNGIATTEEITNRQGPRQQPPEFYQQREVNQQTGEIPSDPRIDLILRAAQGADNEFLSSLATQYLQKGTLTEKQIESGTKQAQKVMTVPRSAPVQESAPWPDEERF